MSDFDDKINPKYSKQPCNFFNNNYPQNNENKTENNKSKQKFTIIVSIVSVCVLLFGAFVYFDIYSNQQNTFNQNSDTKNLELPEKYDIGPLGSDHSHSAMAIFIHGDMIDFGLESFQLKNKYVHFENHNPYLIHRHATGVPLEMFFDSIGIEITKECITVSEKSYCDSMKFFVNEKPYSDIASYIPNHKDRILISLGEGNDISEQLEYLKSLPIYGLPKEAPKDNSVYV